ncbi:MAG TPA: hypothetical protein VII12_19000 [Thermoanaerobaculia bacterium]
MESAPYKDRSAGLVFFGIVHILLGLLFAGLALLTIAGAELARRGGTPMPPQTSIAQNLLIYSLLAAYAFTIGVGSIRGRRWACALAAAFSWLWLLTGIVSGAMLIIFMPRLLQMVPPASAPIVIGCIVAIVAVFYLLLPLSFVLFYQRADVRATCAARDPKPRWTDRVPVPVLALCILLGFAALVLIANVGHPVVPILGTILTGPPAALTLIALAGLLGWLAVQLYRLKESAWWTVVLLQVIGGILGALTFARININRLYEAMGMMTPQLRGLHLEQIFDNPILWIFVAATWIGYLAFLIWLRRYFVGKVTT